MNQNAPCVFIADDDEDDCYLLARAFREHSPECRLQFASDGEGLLETLAQSESLPNLILLDLNMPRLDGFEALQRLRQKPALSSHAHCDLNDFGGSTRSTSCP